MSQTIAIIGAGTMGHGIVQVFALAGWRVHLTDNNQSTLETAIARVEANLKTSVEYGFVAPDEAAQAPARITLTPTVETAVANADLIIEAVFEDLALKRELLPRVETAAPSHALITSNTSSFRVGSMADTLRRPDRFLVTHFWNPPHIVPLVEVVRGEMTADATVTAVMTILRSVGKQPALVKKDVSGFVGNRLQHALRREAIAIVDQGIASAEDVDLIARQSFGLRLPVVGPLETVDLAGLDLSLAIQTNLLPDLDRSTAPTQLLRDKVARGELGAKTGQGFFAWTPEKLQAAIRRRDAALMTMLKWLRENSG